jgi:hypothetical protein
VSTLSTLIQHSLGIPSQNNKIRRNKRNINQKISNQTIPVNRQHDLLFKRSEKLLGLMNIFSKVAGYKINLQKSVAILYTNNEQIKNIEKSFHFQ